jgi:hypothetical protein
MKLAKLSILLASTTLLTVSGCSGGIKENLGITRRSPDEFKVVSRPLLSVPPQFNLRPPSNSAESPIIVPADKQAKSIITGTAVSSDSNSFDLKEAVDTTVIPVETISLTPEKSKKSGKNEVVTKTPSNASFMQNIGAEKADPKVRENLVEQQIAVQEKKEESSWWNVFSSEKPEAKEPLVNAKGEVERIKTNKATNKPVTEGKTPEVKDKDKGLLGDIFGW